MDGDLRRTDAPSHSNGARNAAIRGIPGYERDRRVGPVRAGRFGLFANSIYTTATTSVLAAVPLFIAMGEIMFRSGTMEVLFNSLDRLVGRFRGRQYVVCILLSAILGALSGAAMAVAGLLGRSLFPAMRARGYDTSSRLEPFWPERASIP